MLKLWLKTTFSHFSSGMEGNSNLAASWTFVYLLLIFYFLLIFTVYIRCKYLKYYLCLYYLSLEMWFFNLRLCVNNLCFFVVCKYVLLPCTYFIVTDKRVYLEPSCNFLSPVSVWFLLNKCTSLSGKCPF